MTLQYFRVGTRQVLNLGMLTNNIFVCMFLSNAAMQAVNLFAKVQVKEVYNIMDIF